jgi:hypothetical protein
MWSEVIRELLEPNQTSSPLPNLPKPAMGKKDKEREAAHSEEEKLKEKKSKKKHVEEEQEKPRNKKTKTIATISAYPVERATRKLTKRLGRDPTRKEIKAYVAKKSEVAEVADDTLQPEKELPGASPEELAVVTVQFQGEWNIF